MWYNIRMYVSRVAWSRVVYTSFIVDRVLSNIQFLGCCFLLGGRLMGPRIEKKVQYQELECL